MAVADDELPWWALKMRKEYHKRKNHNIEKDMTPVLASGEILSEIYYNVPWRTYLHRTGGSERWEDLSEVVLEIFGETALYHIRTWEEFCKQLMEEDTKKRIQSTETLPSKRRKL